MFKYSNFGISESSSSVWRISNPGYLFSPPQAVTNSCSLWGLNPCPLAHKTNPLPTGDTGSGQKYPRLQPAGKIRMDFWMPSASRPQAKPRNSSWGAKRFLKNKYTASALKMEALTQHNVSGTRAPPLPRARATIFFFAGAAANFFFPNTSFSF